MQMANNSEYSVPFWAHELSNILAFHFNAVITKADERVDHAEDFKSPISPVALLQGANSRPFVERLYYQRKGELSRNQVRSALHFSCIQCADTLAWRGDLHEAWEKDGWNGVQKWMAQPSHQTEKLRGQVQLANDFLWYPMPKDLNLAQRATLPILERLRFVCRRRQLTAGEILFASALDLYVVLCRPSHNDVLKRAKALDVEEHYDASRYATLSNMWGSLDEMGLCAGLRPTAKALRAYIKHLTEPKE